MTNPTKHHSDFWSYNDQNFRFDVFESSEIPEDKNFTQVYTILLNKDQDKILCVYNKKGHWILPGGTIEEGESLTETLIREVEEESNRTVCLDSIEFLYFQDTFKNIQKDEWEYSGSQARFLAIVDQDNEFVKDPDEDIVKTEWVHIDQVAEYLNWSQTGPFLVNLLKERLSV